MIFFNQIKEVFKDFFILIVPGRQKDNKYKFAFIVHPRSRNDVERKFPFFKYLPNLFIDIFTRYFWPITVSRITGLKSQKNGEEIEGYVISILPTAHQMSKDRSLALKRIIQACKLAKKKGVKIVGLGGLTSSFSKGGLDLIDKVEINITTGHAYTSYNVAQNVFALVDLMGLKKESVCVGVVGAAGSVGSTTAKLIAREGFKNLLLIDIERKKNNCIELVKDIFNIDSSIMTVFSHQVIDIRKCDIVIAATNAPEALIQAEHLKRGAIVIDDAQPSDVHPGVFDREDVLVVEAGVTHTPNINNNFNFGLKSRHDNFCCLAEVLILAANEWDKHYVINRASLDLVDNVSKLGKEMNFKLGKFQNFREAISDDRLVFVRKCIQNELTA